MSFTALQAAWAEWLLEGFIAAGVRRVVVSPGSRSTPLVLAIARAETAGRLDAAVVVDERAAAFHALGAARATGVPTLLVCTSGTAGAHYLPAVVEASEARIPLLVLTADRPFELRGRGAPQTIEQSGMFGRFVRRTFELGSAESDPRAVDGLLRTGILATHAARWPDPGPVHVNAAFRKPLEPVGASHPDVDALSRRVNEALAAGLGAPDVPVAQPSSSALDGVAERLRAAGRGLIVLGPCEPAAAPSAEAVSALARSTGFPVLAEATSQHRFGAAGFPTALDVSEPLFGSPRFLERLAPDLVLQVGGAPTGRALGAWIARSGVERIVLARHGVPEAFNQAARIVVADLEPALEGLADRLSAPVGVDTDWREAIERAVGHARALADEAAGREGSQGEAVRAAVEAIPEGGLLMVGNSMPVRDVDLYVPAEARSMTVLSQRGAAGIDGLIAGAAGAAAATGSPTLLLLGDVSFQHDVGGLAAASRCEAPLAIVVVGNGGGRLFELLPLRSLPDVGPTFERYFLTPPGVDSVLAAQAFGVRGLAVTGGTAAREALRSALAAPGATVIEVRVDPHGADETRRLEAEMDAWPGD